jgi:Mg2+ and Co2+ transporter CorA
MQTLAVVSTIYLPITFLAGFYGTNFDDVPEYHWDFSYAYFWVIYAAITFGFIVVLFGMNIFNTS